MLIGIAIFTAVEVVTLVLWLSLISRGLLAGAVLGAGLFVEHIIQRNVKRGLPLLSLSGLPTVGIAVFTVLEALIWIVALVLRSAQGFIFGISSPYALPVLFLFATLSFKHALATNVIDRGVLSFEGATGGRNLIASAFEAVAGGVWLVSPSLETILLLAAGSLTEHILLTVQNLNEQIS